MSKGTLIKRTDPIYPADALKQGVQGEVVLQVRIGEDGVVHDSGVIRGESRLAHAAEQAVKQWRFSPYRIDHEPVTLPAEITFEFNVEK
jgi:protein TonB